MTNDAENEFTECDSIEAKLPEDKLCCQLRNSVVKIETTLGFGTGFWVTPELILTCAHVITHNDTPTDPERVIWRDQESRVRVVAASEQLDLALLRPSDLGVFAGHSYALLHDELQLDDKLYSFGFSNDYPDGEPFAPLVEGSSPKPLLIKLREAQIVPGFSGSPLLNRRTGAVVGVVRRTRDEFSSLGGRAIPISAARAAFHQIASGEEDRSHSDTEWGKALSTDQLRLLGLHNHSSQRVVQTFRLLHYDIEEPPTDVSADIDVLATKHDGDIDLRRAICYRQGPVSKSDVDSFDAALHKLNRVGPNFEGTIVGTGGFEADAELAAQHSSIRLTPFKKLDASLINARPYCEALIAECETNQRYRISDFIIPDIGETLAGDVRPGDHYVNKWLDDPSWRQLTLLGDMGTGKTFLSRVTAYKLAKEYLDSSETARIPILIDLRNADRQFTLEGLVLSHFQQSQLRNVSFPVFMHCLSSGRIVLFFDGFDEMAARVTSRVTLRNFHELARAAVGRAKVFLTCRTHYFRSRTEEEEVVLARSDDSNESVRDLYLDLVDRRGFSIAYLRSFDHRKVEAYIRRARGADADDVLARIKAIYNLFELCQRPMLLDMIVKTIDRLATSDMTSASLYRVYTDAWVQRDIWHDVLSADQKRRFLVGLARSLWDEQREQIHYLELAKRIERDLAVTIETPHDLVEVDNEIRTASFLIRDDTGHYGFAHKSYREYFLANHLAESLNEGDIDVLNIGRLTKEVCHFLVELCDESVEPLLTSNLQHSYRLRISENAFILLYSMYRASVAQDVDTDDLTISVPERMVLEGADLKGLSLDRVVFRECNFQGTSFHGTIFTQVEFVDSQMSHSDLRDTRIKNSVFESVALSDSSFANATIDECSFQSVDLTGADFNGAFIVESTCENTTLHNTKYLGITTAADVDQHAEKISLLNALECRLPSSVVSEARDAVFRELLPEVQSVARIAASKWGGDEDEITSDIFHSLLSRPIDFRATENVRAYLFNIAHRKSSQSLISRHHLHASLESILEAADHRQDSAEFSLNSSLVVQRLIELVSERFSDDVLHMFQMRFWENMSIKLIAERLGMSTSHVQYRLNRAMQSLRSNPEVQELFEDLIEQ